VAEGTWLEKSIDRFIGDLIKKWKSPRTIGNSAAEEVLSELFYGGVHPDSIKEYWAFDVAEDPSLMVRAKADMEAIENRWRTMGDVRRDLKIVPKASKRGRRP
jgi:hypothetical protein